MPALWCAIYAVVLLLCGVAAISVVFGRQHRSLAEFLGLCFLLGPGVTGILMIGLSMMGLILTRGIILTVGGVAACVTVIQVAMGRFPKCSLPKLEQPFWKNLVILIPMLGMLVAVVMVGIIALRFDHFEGDAVAIWGFKAKVLHIQPLSPKPIALTDPGFSFNHQDYPLLLPMLTAGAYGMMGQLDEALGKVVLPMIYIGQILIAFFAARTRLDRLIALFIAMLLTCAPFNILSSGFGNADAMLATFYLVALTYLLRWIVQFQRSDLVLCSIFCVLMTMTKSEGLPLSLILGGAVLIFAFLTRPRRWSDFGYFLAILLVGAGWWLLWRIGLPHTNDNYVSRLQGSIVQQNIGRIGTILWQLGGEMLEFSRWGMLWMITPIIAIIGFRGFLTPSARFLWAVLFLHLGLYVLIYIISDWDVQRLLEVTQGRLLLHAAPIAMLLIAQHCYALRPILASRK